jgi:hypothetical protein
MLLKSPKLSKNTPLLITNPTGKEAKFLAKILASLSLDKSDQDLIHRLRALADVASSVRTLSYISFEHQLTM